MIKRTILKLELYDALKQCDEVSSLLTSAAVKNSNVPPVISEEFKQILKTFHHMSENLLALILKKKIKQKLADSDDLKGVVPTSGRPKARHIRKKLRQIDPDIVANLTKASAILKRGKLYTNY